MARLPATDPNTELCQREATQKVSTGTSSLPKIPELKIDKDCHVGRSWIEAYIRTILAVCGLYKVSVLSVRVCLSERKGLHFYIAISPPLEAGQANLLQFLLGDDCARVDFNRARINSKLARWNLLFEKPHTRLKTIYRRETTCDTDSGRMRACLR